MIGRFLFSLSLFLLTRHAMANEDHILFLGSSTIELWQSYLPKHFPGRKTTDLGVGGTQYSYLVEHASGWAEQYPDASHVVVYSGDNDITWGNKSPEQVAADFQKTVEILHSRLKNAEFFVLSIKPSLDPQRAAKLPEIDKANDLLEKKAKELGYVYFLETNIPMRGEDGKPLQDFFGPDAIHMNDEGYGLWRNLLSPVLAKCAEESQASKQMEASAPLMYRLHAKTPALSNVLGQARSVLGGIRTELKKACEEQEEVAKELKKVAKEKLAEVDVQAKALQASMRIVLNAQEKVGTYRSKVQKKYTQVAGLVRQFGERSQKKAAAAELKEKNNDQREQLLREAKGGRRLLSSSARRLLSVDHALSLESEKLSELGRAYLEKWGKLSGAKQSIEFSKALAMMAAAQKKTAALDQSRKRLMQQ